MRFSVVICTWNRCELLHATLQSMTLLTGLEGLDWEILVVDNNSSDDTAAVVEEFSTQLPIRRVFEGEPGKSFACNRGIEEAKGDWIVWTDDDVLVDETWLTGYANAAEQHADAGLFGGPVEPLFAGDPPDWLRRSWRVVGTAYCLRDFGAAQIRLSEEYMPYGANWAVRRDVQAETLFDTRLGPRPGVRLLGEDVDVVRRVLRRQHVGWWIPEAGLRHYIPPERQTVGYLAEYYHGVGMTEAFLAAKSEGQPEVALLLGRPRWMWRPAISLELRYRLSRLTSSPERWLEDLKRSREAWGRLEGSKSR